MRLSLRNRILTTFVLVIVAFAVIGVVAGTLFINYTTVEEEQRRVAVDLKAAWSVLHGELDRLSNLLAVLGSGKRVAAAYEGQNPESARIALESVRRQFNLDFLTLTDDQGRVIMRATPPYMSGDYLVNDAFIQNALRGKTTSGFVVLDPERLDIEGRGLRERAFVVFEQTPKAKPRAGSFEESGLGPHGRGPGPGPGRADGRNHIRGYHAQPEPRPGGPDPVHGF